MDKTLVTAQMCETHVKINQEICEADNFIFWQTVIGMYNG